MQENKQCRDEPERFRMTPRTKRILALSILARPLVAFLTASSNVVLRLFDDRTTFTEARLSSEELQLLVEGAGRRRDSGDLVKRIGRFRPAAEHDELATHGLEHPGVLDGHGAGADQQDRFTHRLTPNSCAQLS